MNILYGVQGTGNGHITRAIAITDAMAAYPDLNIDILLSGRPPERIPITARRLLWRDGLTFVTSAGQVQFLKTATSNNVPRALNDIRKLDLDSYDLIVTDFEPTVAWAARLSRRDAIGIGHQYAFRFNVPVRGEDFLNRRIMRYFAPAKRSVGLHWHHFDHPILPPIVDVDTQRERFVEHNKVVVYLPFEDVEQVKSLLKKCGDHAFYIYHPKLRNEDCGHLHLRKTSRETFKDDLLSCNAVICNTGFELISECLALGIKIFTKPLSGQVEQLSNGAALSALDYATVSDNLFLPSIEKWLKSSQAVQVTYPRVQDCLGRWLATGARDSVEELAEKMWRDVEVRRFPQPDAPGTHQVQTRPEPLSAPGNSSQYHRNP